MKKDTIIFGVCSGIAAYKIVGLVRSFARGGSKTVVVMTDHAKQMIPEKDFEKVSGHPVASQLFPPEFDYQKTIQARKVQHISLADEAKLVCVAPATANMIAKLAHGIADDLLSTLILATQAPVLICPSMNVHMWQNPVTQKNVGELIARGFHVLEPATGKLACGYVGQGRLPDPRFIKKEIEKMIQKGRSFLGKRIVVTAGGTEEPIDDVRVITNRSSGKMGVRIAEELCRRGAHVTLIRARTSVDPLCQVRDIKVSTVADMQQALRHYAKNCHAVVHAAAVCDYKAKKTIKGKIKSEDFRKTIELVKTPKLINAIKKNVPRSVLVGFKAISRGTRRGLIQSARNLIKQSCADLVVANDVGQHNVFGSDENEVVLVYAHGKTRLIPRTSKKIIAEKIVDAMGGLLK